MARGLRPSLQALAALAMATVGLSACPPTGAREDGLGVQIRFAATSRSTCARLTLKWAEGDRESPVLNRGDPMKEKLTVAIFRAASMPEEVQVSAEGFSGEGCEAPGTPLERSAERTATFGVRPRELTEVVLEGTGCAAPGGCASPDCEATDCVGGGTCRGGVCRGASREFDCADGVDNDDDQNVDCADPDCLGLSCAPADGCLVGALCGAGVCGGGTPRCEGPPPECRVPVGGCDAGACAYAVLDGGQSCDGGTCNGDGVCLRGFGYVPSNFDPTAVTDPGPPLVIDCAVTIDTDLAAANHFPGWCAGTSTPAYSYLAVGDPTARQPMMIAVSRLAVGGAGSITIRGSQPLVFAVYGDATIEGRVSADADGGTPGPGAQPCATDGGGGAGGRNLTSYIGGGGGGAGLGTRGADGDDGRGGVFGNGNGGAGGNATPASGFVPLRAGCRGGAGWNFGGASIPGAGGGGVQFSVAGTLAISGHVSAGGGGGGPANSTRHGGGSGGGSGGVILLEADTLSLAGAKVTANGGAGGGGKSEANGDGREADAGAGGDPESANPALGGTPGTTIDATYNGVGGPGGNGGAGAVAPAKGGAATPYGGGGGGGGAVGLIRLNANRGCDTAGALFSPEISRGGAFTCP